MRATPDDDAQKNDVETLSAARRRSPDYLGWSLLAVFCCSPIALVPLFFAYSSRACFARKDFGEASRRARWARVFFWITLFSGLTFNSIYIQRHWDELEQAYYKALSQATGEDDGPAPENRFDTVVESRDAAASSGESADGSSDESAAPSETASAPESPSAPSVVPAPSETPEKSGARGSVGVTVETESLGDVLKGTTP